VVRYDARRHGLTEGPQRPFRHYEDLKGLMDFLDITHATVIGLSMGGVIAIDFAIAYPERVEALLPIATGISGGVFTTPFTRRNIEGTTNAIRRGDWEQSFRFYERS